MPPWDRSAVQLIVLLRLAVLLHRGRSTAALPAIELTATPKSLEVRFPARWLKDHPLTAADLQQEVRLPARQRLSPARLQRRAQLTRHARFDAVTTSVELVRHAAR